MEGRSDPILMNDQSRKEVVLRARETGTTWPESVAGQMDRHYSPGRTWEATAMGLLKLLRLGEVLDAGSGDGSVASLLASRCRSITCLDCSTKLLQAARKRLGGTPRVSYTLGDFHDLPFTDASFDQVLLLHVLTYAKNPGQVIQEAARVLRPGGDLLILTLDRHNHDHMTVGYGHVNRGFEMNALRALLRSAHLSIEQCEVGQRDKRPPHFAVLSALAHKPSAKINQTKELL
jgi:ArsR family transcriptional regulator